MWEYISIKDAVLENLVEKANKLGKEGWEGFGFATQQQGLGMTGNHMMVLKREMKGSAESILSNRGW